MKKDSRNILVDLVRPHLDDIISMMFTSPDFKMMCHDDPTIENMMLKRDMQGSTVGVAFVDFSSVNETTPVYDFYGFLTTGIHAETHQEMRTVLYKYISRLQAQIGCLPKDPNDDLKVKFSLKDHEKAKCLMLNYFLVNLESTENPTMMDKQITAFACIGRSVLKQIVK